MIWLGSLVGLKVKGRHLYTASYMNMTSSGLQCEVAYWPAMILGGAAQVAAAHNNWLYKRRKTSQQNALFAQEWRSVNRWWCLFNYVGVSKLDYTGLIFYNFSIRESESIKFATVTCFYHKSCCLPCVAIVLLRVFLSAGYVPRTQGTVVFRHYYFTRYCCDVFGVWWDFSWSLYCKFPIQ